MITGLGACQIPVSPSWSPCGRQIEQGEPIATVVVGGAPRLGHRGCADAYHYRRKEEQQMVKHVSQQGPGGAVDMTQATDMVAGSIPLDTPTQTQPVGALTADGLPTAVRPVAGVPFEEPGGEPGGEGQLAAAVAPVGGMSSPQVSSIQFDTALLLLEQLVDSAEAQIKERVATWITMVRALVGENR